MKTLNRSNPVILLATILVIGITASASASDVPAWAQEQILKPWYAAFNAEDADRLADLYSADGRTGPAKGRSEIIALFESYWADFRVSCSGDYDRFQMTGDLATGWGQDTCIVTPKLGGESKTERSRWLAVYERQANGAWLTIRETYEVVN